MSDSPRGKICHLSSVHRQTDVRIYYKECISLAAAGYQVSFIVPTFEKAPSGPVRIVAVKPVAGRLQRMIKLPWVIFWKALRESAEVYHFHDPELMFVGLLLKLIGKRVIYDAHEDLPADILMKPYILRPLRSIIAAIAFAIEKSCALFYDQVITATPAIAGKFPGGKAQAIQNFPILGELESTESVVYGARLPNVVYAGMISRDRCAVEMTQAMGLIDNGHKARLLLAGAFEDQRLLDEAMALPGWQNVDYRGEVDRTELSKILGQARAGLVLFMPGPNHTESQPNKLFEYMSAGLPLIASDFPLWRALIQAEGCGLLVNPADPRAIADAVTWMLNHPVEARAMGARGKLATEARYNWRAESGKLIKIYSNLIGLRGAASVLVYFLVWTRYLC